MAEFGFISSTIVNAGLTFKGSWNANTNYPVLTSGVGTPGDYYIVSIAGNTNLDGVTDWNVGDWAIFEGTTNMWQKIDNHDIQAYTTIQDEGSSLPQQSVIDFQGAGVTATNGAGKTIVTIPGTILNNTYGSFFDTTNQSPALNAVVAMQYNNTDLAATNGISIVNDLSGKPTRITPSQSGVYNIQFSAQLDRPSGGGGSSADVNIWFAVNGNPVAWSNSRIRMQANDRYILAAWNFYTYLTVGQYAEIIWSQTDAIFLAAVPAGVHPAIPSVILTVNQIK